MAVENEVELRKYAQEFTDEVKAGSTDSGEANQIQLLNNLRESLGDSKLLNDPQFFYWKLPIPPTIIELCGYDIDEIDNSITIFAVDFDEPYHPIAKSVVEKLGNRASNFIRYALMKNKQFVSALENDAADFCDEINTLARQQAGVSKLRVIVVSNGISIMRSREVQASIKDYNIDVEYIVWDINWIYQNCKLEKEHESVVLDFTDDELAPFANKGIPFLQVPQSDSLFDCYQCVVPGRLLSYIYRKYGSPLLEGNVRSFLTTKTSVNKQIQETIQKKPKRFYIYNNGIAAVASGVTTDIVDGVYRITKIDDIQIINGGQTTASLAYAERKRDCDLSEISVPMKLTVIHSNGNEEGDDVSSLIQTISKTSNSQNKVSDADFFANHPFHTQMKKFSESLFVPGVSFNTKWFYERARGEYAQRMTFMTVGQKTIFMETHPKDKYLTKTDFSMYFELYNQRPDLVSKGGVTNFNEFAKYINKEYDEGRQAKFNEIFFKEVAAVGCIYRTLKPLINKNNVSWFEGSYRANILNYAISLFFYLLKQQSPDNDFDLTVVWDRGVSEPLKDMLMDLCREVYKVLVDDSRPVENVTQWAKRSACWDNMKDVLGSTQLELSTIAPYLKDKLAVASEKKEASYTQNIQNQIDVYSVAFDAQHRKIWEPLYFFFESNRDQFPDADRAEEICLEHMVKAMKGKMAPTEYDCKIALDILRDAELVGFQR